MGGSTIVKKVKMGNDLSKTDHDDAMLSAIEDIQLTWENNKHINAVLSLLFEIVSKIANSKIFLRS